MSSSAKIHQGRAVGGSTVHNINLCKRVPEPVLDDWIRTRGLEHLGRPAWDALYTETESMLGVSGVHPGRWNRHNLLLQAGSVAIAFLTAALAVLFATQPWATASSAGA